MRSDARVRLPPEELLALVEPVEGVLSTIVSGEVNLGESWRRLSLTAMALRLGGAE